jgi:hypothetical protein
MHECYVSVRERAMKIIQASAQWEPEIEDEAYTSATCRIKGFSNNKVVHFDSDRK